MLPRACGLNCRSVRGSFLYVDIYWHCLWYSEGVTPTAFLNALEK
jgi:hypothetical protein